MKYKYDNIDIPHLSEIIKSKGLSKRDFEKLLWGEDTHRTIAEFNRQCSIKTAVDICAALDITMDDLLQESDSWKENPTISGEINNINAESQNPNMNDVAALQMLIEEKDKRIEDLKKVNDQLFERLGKVTDSGQTTSELNI